MAVSIDPLKTGTSDEVNPTFASLTVSGPVTLSGGTANGIAYLNGSKVLTTGSDLTWNGVTLGVAGPINASGGIESLASVSVTKDGSDSIGSGPLMQVRNEGGRRSWAQQLSASNNLDWWHLDGSWTKYMTLSTAGLAVTGSISATGQVEGATLRVNVTPTAETPSATHTAVFNINGTNYKFLCLAA